MLRLITGDLLANARIWIGAVVVAAAAAAIGTVAAAQIETAVRTGGDVALALYGISGLVIVFSTVTAVVVLGSVVDLAVTLQRRSYGLWQLIGIRPGLVRLVVRVQLAAVALAGAAIGCGATGPALGPLFRALLSGTQGLTGVRPRFGGVSVLVVGVVVLLIVELAGGRAIGQAGRVPALQVLREPDPPVGRVTIGRLVGAGLLTAIVVLIAVTVPGTAPDRLPVPLMLIAPLTAGALALLGPRLYPAFVRLWTAAVPERASAAWYLARNSVTEYVSRSSAAISPLLVAVALAGGFATATTAGASATHRPATVDTGTVVLLLGGPLLLALLGSTATILMSGLRREKEFALIQAAGATRTGVLAAAGCEALIYSITAAVLGAAATAITSVVAHTAVPGVAFGGAAVASVAGLGAALILAATLVPAAATLRHEVPRTLAAE
jgi:putative ABC transport system permease protein